MAEISNEEQEVFVTESRELYVEVSSVLNVSPKMDTSVFPISRNTPVERSIQQAIESLNNDKLALLTSKGNEVKKLVAIVEQIKQKGPKDLQQLNRLSLLPSLINPSYASKHSIANIQAFFGDEIEMGDQEKAARKEIQGHKVYDIPCLSILLVRKAVNVTASKLPEWNTQ